MPVSPPDVWTPPTGTPFDAHDDINGSLWQVPAIVGAGSHWSDANTSTYADSLWNTGTGKKAIPGATLPTIELPIPVPDTTYVNVRVTQNVSATEPMRGKVRLVDLDDFDHYYTLNGFIGTGTSGAGGVVYSLGNLLLSDQFGPGSYAAADIRDLALRGKLVLAFEPGDETTANAQNRFRVSKADILFGGYTVPASGTAKLLTDFEPMGERINLRARSDTTLNVKIFPPDISTPDTRAPIRLNAVTIPEYILLNGWPVERPEISVREESATTCAKGVVDGQPDIDQLNMDSTVRWVSAANYTNSSNLWTPFEAEAGYEDWNWVTSNTYAPTMDTNYDYKIRGRNFDHQAIKFSSDDFQHFWSDFPGGFNAGNPNYSVIFVVRMTKTHSDNPLGEGAYNTIWSKGGPTPDLPLPWTPIDENLINGFSFRQRKNDLMWKFPGIRRHKALSFGDMDESQGPMYVGFTLWRDQVITYAGTGPHRLRKGRNYNGIKMNGNHPGQPDQITWTAQILLGRESTTVLHNMDMVLFEVNLYTRILMDGEMRDEIAKLSSAYGGRKK